MALAQTRRMTGIRYLRPTRWAVAASVLIAAIVGTLGCIAAGLLAEHSYERQAGDRLKRTVEIMHLRIKNSCMNTAPRDLPHCLDAAVVEQQMALLEAQRNEYDLVAQRKSAVWAEIVGVSAMLGMALSGLGIWLVWTTFRETKRAADEAKRSADAFISAERAWLEVTVQVTPSTNRTSMILHINATNHGRSDARVTEISWFTAEDDELEGKTLVTFAQNGRRVPPSVDENRTRFRTDGVDLSQRYIGGCLTYDTRFNTGRKSYFLSEIAAGTFSDGSIASFAAHQRSGRAWQVNT